jgi:hypothetical protein
VSGGRNILHVGQYSVCDVDWRDDAVACGWYARSFIYFIKNTAYTYVLLYYVYTRILHCSQYIASNTLLAIHCCTTSIVVIQCTTVMYKRSTYVHYARQSFYDAHAYYGGGGWFLPAAQCGDQHRRPPFRVAVSLRAPVFSS